MANTKTISGVFTVRFRPQDGQPATIYSIAPNYSQFHFTRRDDNSLYPASILLTCKVRKTVLTETELLNIKGSGFRIYLSTSGMPDAVGKGVLLTDSGYSIESSASNVYLAMFDGNGKIVDRVTIPVVKDGAQGPAGSVEGVTTYELRKGTSTSVQVDAEGLLKISLYYQIIMKTGTQESIVTIDNDEWKIEFRSNEATKSSEYYCYSGTLDYNSGNQEGYFNATGVRAKTGSDTSVTYFDDTLNSGKRPTQIVVELKHSVSGVDTVLGRDTVAIVYSEDVYFKVNEDLGAITARVNGTDGNLANLSSQLEMTKKDITANSSAISQNKSDIAKLELTAKGLTSTVTSMKTGGNNLLVDTSLVKDLNLRDADGEAVRLTTNEGDVTIVSGSDANSYLSTNHAKFSIPQYSGINYSITLSAGSYKYKIGCYIKKTTTFLNYSGKDVLACNIEVKYLKDGNYETAASTSIQGDYIGTSWGFVSLDFTVSSNITHLIQIYVPSGGELYVGDVTLTRDGTAMSLPEPTYTNPQHIRTGSDSSHSYYLIQASWSRISWENLALKANTKYRLSFMMRVDTKSVYGRFIVERSGMGSTSYHEISISNMAAGVWQQHSIEFTTDSVSGASVKFYPTACGVFRMCRAMLTEGEGEYPWSEGSADAAYTQSQIKQTAESIHMSVKNEQSEAGMLIEVDGIQFVASKIGFLSSRNGKKLAFFEEDDAGYPHLVFLGPDDNKSFDVSWEGFTEAVKEAKEATYYQWRRYFCATGTSMTPTQVLNTSQYQSYAYTFSAGYTVVDNVVAYKGGDEALALNGKIYLYGGSNYISNHLPSGNTLANGIYLFSNSEWSKWTGGPWTYSWVKSIVVKSVINGVVGNTQTLWILCPGNSSGVSSSNYGSARWTFDGETLVATPIEIGGFFFTMDPRLKELNTII